MKKMYIALWRLNTLTFVILTSGCFLSSVHQRASKQFESRRLLALKSLQLGIQSFGKNKLFSPGLNTHLCNKDVAIFDL